MEGSVDHGDLRPNRYFYIPVSVLNTSGNIVEAEAERFKDEKYQKVSYKRVSSRNCYINQTRTLAIPTDMLVQKGENSKGSQHQTKNYWQLMSAE